MRTASPARWLRAAVLAGSSVGLAAGAHFAAGGQAEPAFLILLLAAATAAGYHWSKRERGLLAIVTAVLVVQAAVHLTLGLGHSHAGGSMLVSHLAAALLLAGFLRFGEARVHAAARRRYVRWLVAVRLALAKAPVRPVWIAPLPATVEQFRQIWIEGPAAGRGPPAVTAL